MDVHVSGAGYAVVGFVLRIGSPHTPLIANPGQADSPALVFQEAVFQGAVIMFSVFFVIFLVVVLVVGIEFGVAGNVVIIGAPVKTVQVQGEG